MKLKFLLVVFVVYEELVFDEFGGFSFVDEEELGEEDEDEFDVGGLEKSEE